MNVIEKYLNSQIKDVELVMVSKLRNLYTIQYEFKDTRHGGWVCVSKEDLLKFERIEKIKSCYDNH